MPPVANTRADCARLRRILASVVLGQCESCSNASAMFPVLVVDLSAKTKCRDMVSSFFVSIASQYVIGANLQHAQTNRDNDPRRNVTGVSDRDQVRKRIARWR